MTTPPRRPARIASRGPGTGGAAGRASGGDGARSRRGSASVKIAPSILAADFSCLGREVADLCAAGCDRLHVDVMDGRFVPNLTVGPDVVRAIGRHAARPLDVHLMISPVDPHVRAFADAGADLVIFHPEAGFHPRRTVDAVREAGCRVGVSLNPATPLCAVDHLIDVVDMILVMTVEPGFGGQSFMVDQIDKIRRLRTRIDATGRHIELGVDGGVDADTAVLAVRAGADVLIAGTSVFRGGPASYADNIAALRFAAP